MGRQPALLRTGRCDHAVAQGRPDALALGSRADRKLAELKRSGAAWHVPVGERREVPAREAVGEAIQGSAPGRLGQGETTRPPGG